MKKILTMLALLSLSSLYADSIKVFMQTTGGNMSVGTIEFKDSKYGLLIYPDLSMLPPGVHGFHLHEKPSCADNGMAAGGHYDPGKTNSHLGPYGKGHLGDLPVLIVDAQGNAKLPTLAPRLKINNLDDLAVMVHLGGDNYSNHPKLGGGGQRIACGIVSQTKSSSAKKSVKASSPVKPITKPGSTNLGNTTPGITTTQ